MQGERDRIYGARDQLGACACRLCRLTEVRHIVERVVEAEHVYAVCGSRGDESPDEVVVDGTRADEEAAPEREAERRLHMRLQGPDPLPGALHAAANGTVET